MPSLNPMAFFALSKEQRQQYSPGSENQKNPPINIPNPSHAAKEEGTTERWTHKSQHVIAHDGKEPLDWPGRFLKESPQDTWVNKLFGAKEAEPGLHPCVHQSNVLHQCLDANDDKIDFCRPAWNVMLGCVRLHREHEVRPWYNSFLPFKPFGTLSRPR